MGWMRLPVPRHKRELVMSSKLQKFWIWIIMVLVGVLSMPSKALAEEHLLPPGAIMAWATTEGLRIEIGPGTSDQDIIRKYGKQYKERTGEDLTPAVLQAANPKVTWSACYKPPPGVRAQSKGDTSAWKSCAEKDQYVILMAGPSGRFTIPMTAVETNAQHEEFMAKVDAAVKAGKSDEVLSLHTERANRLKKKSDPEVKLTPVAPSAASPTPAPVADADMAKAKDCLGNEACLMGKLAALKGVPVANLVIGPPSNQGFSLWWVLSIGAGCIVVGFLLAPRRTVVTAAAPGVGDVNVSELPFVKQLDANNARLERENKSKQLEVEQLQREIAAKQAEIEDQQRKLLAFDGGVKNLEQALDASRDELNVVQRQASAAKRDHALQLELLQTNVGQRVTDLKTVRDGMVKLLKHFNLSVSIHRIIGGSGSDNKEQLPIVEWMQNAYEHLTKVIEGVVDNVAHLQETVEAQKTTIETLEAGHQDLLDAQQRTTIVPEYTAEASKLQSALHAENAALKSTHEKTLEELRSVKAENETLKTALEREAESARGLQARLAPLDELDAAAKGCRKLHAEFEQNQQQQYALTLELRRIGHVRAAPDADREQLDADTEAVNAEIARLKDEEIQLFDSRTAAAHDFSLKYLHIPLTEAWQQVKAQKERIAELEAALRTSHGERESLADSASERGQLLQEERRAHDAVRTELVQAQQALAEANARLAQQAEDALAVLGEKTGNGYNLDKQSLRPAPVPNIPSLDTEGEPERPKTLPLGDPSSPEMQAAFRNSRQAALHRWLLESRNLVSLSRNEHGHILVHELSSSEDLDTVVDVSEKLLFGIPNELIPPSIRQDPWVSSQLASASPKVKTHGFKASEASSVQGTYIRHVPHRPTFVGNLVPQGGPAPKEGESEELPPAHADEHDSPDASR
jgi:hypothetical protein